MQHKNFSTEACDGQNNMENICAIQEVWLLFSCSHFTAYGREIQKYFIYNKDKKCINDQKFFFKKTQELN